MATIRYFAAAAEAAGMDAETLDLPSPISVASLHARLVQAHPDLAPVLPVCSMLVDGVSHADPAEDLHGVHQIDVLPPFAGG